MNLEETEGVGVGRGGTGTYEGTQFFDSCKYRRETNWRGRTGT